MSTKSIDVYVYIQSPEGENLDMDIVKAISNQTGVLKADNNQKVKKMLDVQYDPELTSGNVILNFVRGKGYNSYLVGM